MAACCAALWEPQNRKFFLEFLYKALHNLGRKNYLFAGSHDAAQRSAIMYSFFASCKKHDVNPAEWLKYTLENIMTINHKNIRDLYPQNYKKMMEANQ